MVCKFNIVMVLLALVNGVCSSTTDNKVDKVALVPCTCGVFLSYQFKKGSKTQPTGEPVFLQEFDRAYDSGSMGIRKCTQKCLGTMVKYVPSSASLICAAIDRDCHKERAHLFVKNGQSVWHNTNLSAGREYCCRHNKPYKCLT